MAREVPWKRLIFVPAIVSLAVTVLRLLGELLGGPHSLFNPKAGGPLALVGIVWLIPVFGFYFGWKLTVEGYDSVPPWRTLGGFLLGFVVLAMIIGGAGSFFENGLPPALWFINLCSIAVILVTRLGWPELWVTLLAYALAARIPVAVIMFFAILGDWGTHYDVPPRPDFPQLHVLYKYFLIGLLPQLVTWVAFTLAAGGIFGGLGQIAARLRGRPAEAT